MAPLGLTRRRLRLAFLAVGLVSITMHAWDLATPGLLDRTGRLKAPDFLQFYTYGSLARAHDWDRLYDAAAHAEMARRVDPRMTLSGFHPNYGPIVALLMAPLATLPFLHAWMLWCVISLALYGVATVLVARMTTRVCTDPLTLALGAIAFPALMMVIRYGQISAVSLLLIALAACQYSRRRPFVAGLALGALAYKPNLLIVPVLALAATREFRVLGGLLVAACLEAVLGLALIGWSGLSSYAGILTTLATDPDLVQAFPTESHSLRGFVRLLVPVPAVLAIVSVAAVAVGTWVVFRVWRQTTDPRPRWAALTLATLIATPHLLTYDLLLLAVPVVLMVDWTLSSRWPPTESWWAAMALLYGAAWPGTFIARLYSLQLSTVGMAVTLWLLVALSRSETPAPDRTDDSSSSNPIINS
jgi:hypothetical protein